MDFPTLGLNFDLNALVEGTRRMGEARGLFVDVGRAADQASDKVERSGDAFTAAGLAAEAAAFKSSRAVKSQDDDVRRLTERLRELERVQRLVAMADKLRTTIDRDAQIQKEIVSTKALARTIELVGQASEKAAREKTRGWERVSNAIKLAADQTVRAGQIDAESRVRITQAAIAQNRQSALTQESLSREALLVDRLTKELRELGAARAAAARQGAAPGANADLLGQAAATSVIPIIATAQSGLNGRAAQLAENQAREQGRRGILAYVAALFGLGRAQEQVDGRVRSSRNVFSSFGQTLREVRLRAFDLRFALAGIFAAITLGPLAGMADQMVALESRTRLYAERASDVPIILEATFAAAQRARAPLEGLATLYTRLAPLGDQLGRSQLQLLGIAETVAKAFSIGGASAAEATAGAQQFAQALSSNRFGGDELRSVAENAPVLLQAIAEGVNQINPALNLNAATFIKWAQEGNANSSILVQALEIAAGKINTMFESTTPTISQATSVIQNSLTKLVDEVDRRSGEAGLRLSTNIAQGLIGFSEFLNRQSTIDAIVGSVEALKTGFGLLGTALTLVAQYFPAVVASVLAFAVASNAATLATALAAGMRGLAVAAAATSLAFTGATGKVAIFSGVMATSQAAVLGIGGAMRTLGALMLSPLGLAALFAGAALAMNYFATNTYSAQKAADVFSGQIDQSSSALQRAISLFQTYGGQTEASKKQVDAFNKTINDMIGLTDDQTRGLDAAGQAALQRARMEQQLTVALLRRAAAESILAGAELNRSAAFNDIKAGANRLAAATELIPSARRESQRRAEEFAGNATFQRNLAADLIGGAPGLNAAADAAAALQLSVPSIDTGSMRTSLGSEDDKDTKGGRSLAGAINSVARLSAEVVGLNDQIQALSTNPLSDVAARITAAAREAGAARTAGPGAGFRNEAQIQAALKEEASIRLDLTRSLMEQARAAEEAGQADFYGRLYSEDATAAMTAFYTGATRSSAGYIAALNQQADAQVAGEKAQANLALAQRYGVTNTNEIADAYRAQLAAAGLLTEETTVYADRLQATAEATYRAAAAAIDLATARERSEQSAAARLARQAEIADLEDYAAALAAGAAALDAYNRQKAVNAAIEEEGPLASTGNFVLDQALALSQQIRAENDIDRANGARYNAALAERSTMLAEQLRLAQETTRYRQIEAEALALAQAAGRTAVNDNDRQIAGSIIGEREVTDLKVKIQDAIRSAFIETGKIDLSSLRQGLTEMFRQSFYDALIARPMTIVVNAVVNVVTKGINSLIDKLANAATGGTGGLEGAVGRMTDKFSDGLDKLIAKIPESVKAIAGNSIAGYQIGTGISDMFGLTGSDSRWQQAGDAFGAVAGAVIGGMIGGPIGALIGSTLGTIASRLVGTLFGSKDRPLAITALEVRDGQFQSVGTRAYDGGPMEEIDQAGKELAVLLNKISKAFNFDLGKANGLYTVFGFSGDENTKALGGGGFFGGLLNEFSSIQGKSLDDIKGSALGRGLDFSNIKDSEEALDLILRDVIIRIGDAVGQPFTEAEKRLINAAESLEEAAATLFAARNVETSLERQLLKFTNPREAAVLDLRDSQLVRRQEIMDLVDQGLIGQDRLPGIESLLQQLERAELGDLLGRFNDGLTGTISSLEDLTRAQERLAEYTRGLLLGTLSPLSPAAKLEASSTEFDRLLALAQGGDATAIERLASNGSNDFLSAAQRYFGSSEAYSQIFDRVVAQLEALSTQEFAEDPLISTLEAEFQRLIDAVNAGFLLIYQGPTVLPDQPTELPGTGGTGPVTGGSTGGGQTGGGTDPAVVNELRELSNQVARLGETFVASNNNAAQTIVDGVTKTDERVVALAGGAA